MTDEIAKPALNAIEGVPRLAPSRRATPMQALGAAILGIAMVLALVAAGAAWRLSQGPADASAFTPAVERLLAAQVKGGRAHVRQAQFVLSRQAGTVGLSLEGVSLRDGRGRPVLAAQRLDYGWSLASLAALRPSAGRVGAANFYAAVSVSPQGRYGLGWDTAGAPRGRSDLTAMLEDLTGKTRRNRPLSYLSEVELTGGAVDLRQNGGPLAWRGQVQQVRFRKSERRLDGAVDVTIGQGAQAAALKLRGRGSVGLGQADAQAWLARLNPSMVFPSVGPTRVLSALDAQVDGQAQLAYAARRGLQAADVQLTAGEGRLRVGGALEPFHQADFRAVLDPKTQSVSDRMRVSAARADFDLTGTARLIPDSRNAPASLRIALHGETGALLLAGEGEKQPLHDIDLRARIVPALGRIEIEQARVVVGEAPVDAHGALTRGRPGRAWGVSLDGQAGGWTGVRTVLALWPDSLANGARTWVVQHIPEGRVGQVTHHLRLPPGGAPRGRPMPNPWINVDFAVQDGQVRIRDDMPVVQQAAAHAVLQGDRFDLQLSRAVMNEVTLSSGVVTLPRLSGDGQRYDVQVNGAGDLRKIVELVDAPGDHVLTRQGMPPTTFSGQSEVTFRIGRPLGRGYGDDFKNYEMSYRGVVRQAKVTNVALGLDLAAPVIKVEGGEDQLTATGDVRLGPYKGPLDFSARFAPDQPTVRKAVLKGALDMSGVGFGGSGGSSMPFSARFESRDAAGEGVITSRGFTGKADWRQGAAGRILVQGRIDPTAWRAIGVPISAAMSEKAPARLDMRRIAGGWSGVLDAGVYSGAVSLAAGPVPRLRYVAELSPAEARELGLGGSTAFARPQPMVIDVAGSEAAGQAAYTVGPMKGQVSWQTQTGKTQYRWRAALAEADLHAMGLPVGISPRGLLNVDVAMSGSRGGWSGTAQAPGANLKFTAQAGPGGRRTISFSGPLDGSVLDLLGVLPEGSVDGPLTASGQFDVDARGLAPGRLDLDLTRASLVSTAAGYSKPAGRALRMTTDFAHNPDGSIQASRLHAEGPGVAIDASGLLRPQGLSTIDARTLRVDGIYDGSLQLAADDRGRTIVARGRFFDARPLIHDLGTARGGGGGKGGSATVQPVRLDLDINQVKVSDRTTLTNLHATGIWADPARRRLDVSASTTAGSGLSVHLAPDSGGGLISARITNVADVADSVLGVGGFAGGSATVQGRLQPEGADFEVEMRNVRLVRAPVLAQILTMGSLRGMADTLNGEGVSFTRVTAPMKLRGSRLTIGDARAVGGSLGLTGKGVVDIDRRTMDLSGAIAPAQGINSMLGSVPLVGQLLVSKKGEGLFGVTYSAKGPFAEPKVSVNPFSLAAPGILRRMFEPRPSAARDEPPRPLAAAASPQP